MRYRNQSVYIICMLFPPKQKKMIEELKKIHSGKSLLAKILKVLFYVLIAVLIILLIKSFLKSTETINKDFNYGLQNSDELEKINKSIKF